MDEVLTPSASEHSSPSGWRASRRDPQLRVYWNVFWANLALCVFELASGAAGYGPLLVVDGLASAAIAAVVTTILFGVELSRPQVVTAAYPYGKGKVQYLTALAFGALLAAAGAGVLALSIKSFFGPTELGPLAIGMAVAGVSLVSNVLLLLYLRAVGSRTPHPETRRLVPLQLLGVAASLVAVQSLALSGLVGWFLPERMGTVTICLITTWLSVQIIRRALDGIMDRSGGFEPLVVAVARSLDEVEGVEWVRTRHIGHALAVNVLLRVPGDFTVRQGDQVATQFRRRLALELKDLDHAIEVACSAA
jgi:cation diffusion facilitator family transporter